MMTLSRNWWALVVRGLLAIIFGILTFLWPGMTLLVLTLLFGAYALLDGIFAITAAIRGSEPGAHWWVLVLEGIAGILAAAAAVLVPGITLLFLVLLVGGWAIVTGALEIAAAVRLRRHVHGEWLLGLAGVASIVLGILLFLAPAAGALVLALWIGAYAIVFGVILVALGFRLRHHPTLHPLAV